MPASPSRGVKTPRCARQHADGELKICSIAGVVEKRHKILNNDPARHTPYVLCGVTLRLLRCCPGVCMYFLSLSLSLGDPSGGWADRAPAPKERTGSRPDWSFSLALEGSSTLQRTKVRWFQRTWASGGEDTTRTHCISSYPAKTSALSVFCYWCACRHA